MITITEIHKGIYSELKALDELVDEIRALASEAAQTETIYKREFARARLSIRALAKDKPTVGQIDDEAEDLTSVQRMAYLSASHRLTACREALRASQAKLDGWRSLLSSVKAAGG